MKYVNISNIFVFIPVNIHGFKAHFNGTEILSPGNSNFRGTINNMLLNLNVEIKCREYSSRMYLFNNFEIAIIESCFPCDYTFLR